MRARLDYTERSRRWHNMVDAEAKVKLREKQVADAERVIGRHGGKAGKAPKATIATAPTVITADELGLSFSSPFGDKGTPYRVTGHYSAGPRAKDEADLRVEARRDHAFHKAKGWGGLSYDVMIADDGTILLGNPMKRKSAHVAGNNSGNVGICCPGTTGDKPTAAQAESLRWYLANAHTTRIPAKWRSPVDLRNLPIKGHKEYPGNATACPGRFLDMYHARGETR